MADKKSPPPPKDPTPPRKRGTGDLASTPTDEPAARFSALNDRLHLHVSRTHSPPRKPREGKSSGNDDKGGPPDKGKEKEQQPD